MFFAFVMKPDGDIDEVRGYPTEAGADTFAKEETRYAELDPDDDPDHWQKYDPPIVILVEADNSHALENGKFTRPVAIYQRGEKFVCVKSSS